MADGIIMRRRHFCGRLLSFALALSGLGQMSVAQAQTAQGAQALVAAQVEGVSLEGVGITLRAQFADMVRHSGKVLVFGASEEADAGDAGSERFVLYAPLNRLWLLDAAGEVTRHAWIEVRQEPFEHLVLHWTHWSDGDISDILPAAAQMPAFTVESDTPHPLAAHYDALLSKPLARALDPLPAGAYFSAGGHVFDATGVQIGEWDSFGAEIALRLIPAEKNSTAPTVESEQQAKADTTTVAPDPYPVAGPVWQWFAVADLAAALTPKQGDQ